MTEAIRETYRYLCGKVEYYKYPATNKDRDIIYYILNGDIIETVILSWMVIDEIFMIKYLTKVIDV